ncbi:hypothetical protein BBFL7_01118 [Flavobacteria bacterium BBFL7]|nr:hypothetical protein BBFL7_01118 [Flavobacteria bacterium BBFL7]
MKLSLSFFSLLISSCCLAQFGEELDTFFSQEKDKVNQSIKEIKIKEFIRPYNSLDTVLYLNSTEKHIFNRESQILKFYQSDRNDSLFLKEERNYNSTGQIIRLTEYAKEYKFIGDSLDLNSYKINSRIEKYDYKNGLRVSAYRKTSRDKDFYIFQRTFYDKKKKAIQSEFLNTHKRIEIDGLMECRGDPLWNGDRIVINTYAKNGEVKKQKTYIDTTTSFLSNEQNAKIKPNVKLKINSDHILMTQDDYIYNNSKQLIKKIDTRFRYYKSNKLDKKESSTQFTYWGTKESKLTYTFSKNEQYEVFKNYIVIEKDTITSSLKRVDYGNPEMVNEILVQVKQQPDGKFIIYEYPNSKYEIISTFDKHKNIIEIKDLYEKEITRIDYVYDNRQNWIKKTVIGNDTINRVITRKITYW